MSEQKAGKLGKYEIIEEIGRGGFSVVYKALDTSLHNRPVALKVLHPHLLVDPTFVQRLQHEAGAAANLSHSNIVVVYEVGEIDGTYFIAMEYLPGTPLDQLIKKEGPLAPPRAVKIISHIGSALDYAHQEGFIHRDVKSGNIIVGEDDHATLTDFGLVRAAEGTSLTSTGKIVGTPEYMSPEQADPMKTRELDWRTDLYSLGIVAYELLTGQVPFKGDTPTATHYMHVHEKPPKPTLMNPDLPKRVEAPFLKALAKERSDRYQNGEAFADALEKSVGTEKPGTRWKWLVAVGAVSGLYVVASIICVVSILLWLRQPTILPPPTPTWAHAPTASPTDTALPTETPRAIPVVSAGVASPASTFLPTTTLAVTPSSLPSPTQVMTAAPRPTTAPPTATLTIVPTRVADCPANVGCLTVVNHCGDTLTFSIGGEAAAQEIIVQPGTTRMLMLPAGQYGYTASTVTYALDPDRGGKAVMFMELAYHGTAALEAADNIFRTFTVVCEKWRPQGCWSPRIVVAEER